VTVLNWSWTGSIGPVFGTFQCVKCEYLTDYPNKIVTVVNLVSKHLITNDFTLSDL
jgi:hypothetical protein